MTWTEAQTGERPPDEWDSLRKMAYDRFVNFMTWAQIARKYRVNRHTVKFRVTKKFAANARQARSGEDFLSGSTKG